MKMSYSSSSSSENVSEYPEAEDVDFCYRFTYATLHKIS